MSNVFSRSWEITKISFRVMGKDKELLIYPFLAAIFSMIFSVAILVPSIFFSWFETGIPEDMSAAFGLIEYLIVFATYLGLALIATFFNVCVVYTVKTRFEGGNATLGSSFKFAFSKFHLIISWSLLSATVGLLLYILNVIAEKIGGIGEVIVKMIRGIIGMAWNIVTIFVIPGMVYYNLGPKAAIKKSVDTLGKTWGESLIRHFGMGLIQFLVGLLGVGIGVLLFFLIFPISEFYAILIAIGVVIVYFIILFLVFNVANSVYNTSLFVYADTGKIPEGFNQELMSKAFKQKKVRTR